MTVCQMERRNPKCADIDAKPLQKQSLPPEGSHRAINFIFHSKRTVVGGPAQRAGCRRHKMPRTDRSNVQDALRSGRGILSLRDPARWAGPPSLNSSARRKAKRTTGRVETKFHISRSSLRSLRRSWRLCGRCSIAFNAQRANSKPFYAPSQSTLAAEITDFVDVAGQAPV